MKHDSSHPPSKSNHSFLSDDSGTNTSDLSLLDVSQDEYVQRQVSRETQLLDSGDEHPLHNERLPKKKPPFVNTSLLESQVLDDFDDKRLHDKMARHCSKGTTVPPPHTNSSKPGAVHIPGIQTEVTSITLRNESNSRSSHDEPTKSLAPILQASVVNEQEQPSSPRASAASVPVVAEPMRGERLKRSCCFMLKDRRLLVILATLVIIILSFAVGIAIVVSNKEPITTTTVEYIPATPAPTTFTMAPSRSPTEAMEDLPPFPLPEFSPPSPAQCRQIESGNAVPNQDQMVPKTYHVELEIVMEPNVAILDRHFTTLVDRRLQATLAPKLAQCDTLNRRNLRSNSRKQHRNLLVSDYLVANAYFSNAATKKVSCKVGSLCYKLIETVDLYIKREELDVRLISLIMDAFDVESLVQLLDLEFPFKSIHMIGVTSNTNVVVTSTTTPAPQVNNVFDDSHDEDKD